MQDASFEDGREAPLHLGALDAEDLKILSTLAQDAVFPAGEMKWLPRERRFALLLNRFRWEDLKAAETRGRAVERVQALLVIDNVLHVASQGVVAEQIADESLVDLLKQSAGDGEDEEFSSLAGE